MLVYIQYTALRCGRLFGSVLSVLSNLQPRTRRPRDDLKRGQKGKENLDHVTSVGCNPPKSPKSGFPVAYGFVHFCKVPPFLHAVIFTLFRTRSAFAWESIPALTVTVQLPCPAPTLTQQTLYPNGKVLELGSIICHTPLSGPYPSALSHVLCDRPCRAQWI